MFGQIPIRTAVFALDHFLGAWLGAVVIPLDWDQWWQAWPLCSHFGSLFGVLLAVLSPIFAFGQNIRSRVPKRGVETAHFDGHGERAATASPASSFEEAVPAETTRSNSGSGGEDEHDEHGARHGNVDGDEHDGHGRQHRRHYQQQQEQQQRRQRQQKRCSRHFFSQEPPKLCSIIYAEFDNDIGRVIRYQVPDEIFDKQRFDTISSAIIPSEEMRDRMIKINMYDYKITGHPVGINRRAGKVNLPKRRARVKKATKHESIPVQGSTQTIKELNKIALSGTNDSGEYRTGFVSVGDHWGSQPQDLPSEMKIVIEQVNQPMNDDYEYFEVAIRAHLEIRKAILLIPEDQMKCIDYFNAYTILSEENDFGS
ncbi:hypothetical protein niasHT_019088 [Heterodera trifolii]|uniref:Uncharacterized protein n=1 Tax=Heterodera trifolii TaxID=157864 RepID=A0ABD2LB57_9BILA